MIQTLKTHFQSSVLLCLLSLTGGMIALFFLPSGIQVPLKWSLDGEILSIGSPVPAILLVPLGMLATLCLLAYLMRFKRYQKGLQTNAAIISTLIFATTLITVLLQTTIILTSFEILTGPPRWPLAAVGIMFILTGNYLPKTRPNALVGYRLPFIMKDDIIWRKTNRFAAPLLILGGAYLTYSGLSAKTFADIHWRLIMVLIISTVLPIAYSFLVWRNRQSASAK